VVFEKNMQGLTMAAPMSLLVKRDDNEESWPLSVSFSTVGCRLLASSPCFLMCDILCRTKKATSQGENVPS
jgi:hypothetical protein